MKTVLIFVVHLLTVVAKLLGPGTEVRLVIQIANDGLRGDLLQLYSASNK